MCVTQNLKWSNSISYGYYVYLIELLRIILWKPQEVSIWVTKYSVVSVKKCARFYPRIV